MDNAWTAMLANELTDIADQIEREQGGRVSRMRVLAVVTEMERHVSGAEGMEDSPVARWARELREALGGNGRDPATDVSVSAYDLLPQEDREAIAWVREHGGLDAVYAIWDNDVPLAEAVISELWPDGRPDECGNDDVMGELRRRLMPEGCEWPRYESGELVQFGDDVSRHGEDFEANVITLYRDGSFSLNFWAYSKGERVKRPAPKVLDADGVEIRKGDRVWSTQLDEPHEWIVIDPHEDRDDSQTVLVSIGDRTGHARPDNLTHQRPVLDAEGNRIEPAMDVWWVCEGDERGVHAEKLHVESIGDDGLVTCDPFNGGTWVELEPSELYVNRPVLDADGVPIHEVDTVWNATTSARPLTVREIERSDDPDEPEDLVWCGERAANGFKVWRIADQLTHTKPEPPDSRRAIVNEIGAEMAARIDLLVNSGRWSDAD